MSQQSLKFSANHDPDAIKSWLSLKDDNAKTHQAYKKDWNGYCFGRYWNVARRFHRSIPMTAGPILGF
jgi:hypothetical protein